MKNYSGCSDAYDAGGNNDTGEQGSVGVMKGQNSQEELIDFIEKQLTQHKSSQPQTYYDIYELETLVDRIAHSIERIIQNDQSHPVDQPSALNINQNQQTAMPNSCLNELQKKGSDIDIDDGHYLFEGKIAS